MEYNIPRHITGEKDLKYYEEYLENRSNMPNRTSSEIAVCKIGNKTENETRIRVENPCNLKRTENKFTPEALGNPIFFQGYLKNHKGKLVKVESLLNERLESRVGILMDVGYDFIVLKLNRSCCSMMIHSASIKYITIIHDNDMHKTAMR